MAITNTSKPTTAIANSSKVSIGETWATITTTWASETRTWAAASQLISNSSKPRSLGSYTFDEIGTHLISEEGGAISDGARMINVSKPS